MRYPKKVSPLTLCEEMDKDIMEYEQGETPTESHYAMPRLEEEPRHCIRDWTGDNQIIIFNLKLHPGFHEDLTCCAVREGGLMAGYMLMTSWIKAAMVPEIKKKYIQALRRQIEKTYTKRVP
jgi:hypothetical protein